MTAFGRWLPAITQTPVIRKAALTTAGLAFVGGAVAGPMTAAQAAPAESAPKPAASAQDAQKPAAGKELNVKYEPQPNFYYCGPASTRIALTSQGHAPSQDDVAKELGTTENGTNSAEDTTRVLNKIDGGDVYKTKSIPGTSASAGEVDQLKADVKNAVDAERAVVANIAGTTTDADGNVHSYEGGHYLSVVGYRDDGNAVKIADPAKPDQSSYWMSTGDLANWVATRGYSA